MPRNDRFTRQYRELEDRLNFIREKSGKPPVGQRGRPRKQRRHENRRELLETAFAEYEMTPWVCDEPECRKKGRIISSSRSWVVEDGKKPVCRSCHQRLKG